ncbi:MAG TPA: ABC transporter permease, partial [Longimicrobiales bacterium]|nr:ABC transporter permease [Longimicrobiales bacterium]
MTSWRDLWRRILPSRTVEPDVDDELRFHIDGKAEELMGEGMSPEEARTEARRRFGDWGTVRDATRRYARQRARREERRAVLDTLLHDLRHALRTLVRNRGFTAVVVLTLAVGIGATTAIFTVVNGVLLRPLPFPEPDRLVIVWQNDRATGTTREAASTADYWDFRERSRSFSELAMYSGGSVTLTRDEGEPRRLAAAVVSHTLDDVLGIRPVVGRGIAPEEDRPGAGRVALLSHRLWRAEFEADPEVSGRTVRVDDEPVTVIGVLPEGLDFPDAETDLWLPIRETPATAVRERHWVTVIGRLGPGTSLAAARGEMTRIAAELEAEYSANENRGAFVEPLDEVKRGDVRLTLWVLFGAVLTVLLIACANVANLLLARGASRARELAVCAALGAGTGRLARRFVLEGALVAVGAAAGGLVLALGGIRLLESLAPARILALGEVGIDARVLAFTSLVAAAVAVGFGLLPTLQARRLDLQTNLKEGRATGEGEAVGRMGFRRLLVAGQIALAVVLLVSAGLLGVTLRNLNAVDPGFRAENVLRMSYTLPTSRYPRDFSVWPEWSEIHQFHRELLGRVRARPGVSSAAVTLSHPLDPGFTNSYVVVGRPYDPAQGEITVRMVSPGYFETAGLRLLEGRVLRMSDDTEAPGVMVVNRETARRLFPDEPAVGNRIAMWGGREFEIVGVVEGERIHGLTQAVPPAFYLSVLQAPPRAAPITLLVRTAGDPLQLVDPVRRTFREIDPELALFDVSTLTDTVREATARERFATLVLGVFAAVAVFLALLGIHGVLSYLVARRRHEVGVRMALGATAGDVLWLFLRQGLGMTGVGLVVGIAGALASARVLESLLFGISETEPSAYVAVALLLAATGAAA